MNVMSMPWFYSVNSISAYFVAVKLSYALVQRNVPFDINSSGISFKVVVRIQYYIDIFHLTESNLGRHRNKIVNEGTKAQTL